MQSDIPHDALELAAEWFALLRSGEATDQDRQRWQAWLGEKAEHRRAWAFAERISKRFEPLQSSPVRRQAVDAYRAATTPSSRRQVVAGIAVLAGTGALGWLSRSHTGLPDLAAAWTADHRTRIGEIREVALPDGTRVWLNTASAFDVDFNPEWRRLHLRAGEIFVVTAADPARPFVVDGPQGSLRALGTRFTARLEEDRTFVAVYEGAVAINTASSRASTVISAGRQARFTSDAILAITAADPARQAWSRGLLIAENISLGEVVVELQRYRHGHISLAPELSGLHVLGSYPIRDTDRTLSMLAGVLPIEVSRPLPWWTSVRPSVQAVTR